MSIPLVTLLGRMTLAFLEAIGSVTSFALQSVRCALQPPWYRHTSSWWVMSAKKEETRARRLATLIDVSAKGQWIAGLKRTK